MTTWAKWKVPTWASAQDEQVVHSWVEKDDGAPAILSVDSSPFNYVQLLFDYCSITIQLFFNYYSIIVEKDDGRRPSSVMVPFNYCCYKARKIHDYLLQVFFTFQWTNHNYFGHISLSSSFHCLMINWIFCQHLKYLLMLGHDYHSIQLLVCICVCAHIHLPGLQRGCRKKTI